MLELRLEEVTKRFGEKIAVDQASCRMTEGVYGLLGANGAGKTTLMRLICALLTPQSGSVTFCGEPVLRLGAGYRRILGYLPQDFGYYPDFTAEKYLRYLAQLKALPASILETKLEEIWELTGLGEARKKKLKTFSGGMLRRLGLGQAILNDPRVLVLDEPTSGLDPKERIRFRNIISAMGRERIILLSTHIVQDVESVADEILLMKGGRLSAAGSPQQMLSLAIGKVWECPAEGTLAERLMAQYPISNIRHEEGRLKLRIVSGERPTQDSVLAAPNLEDAYLFWQTEHAGQMGETR